MPPSPDQLRAFSLAAAQRLGFDLAGVAGVAGSARLATFPDWMAQGRAGEMAYLGRRGESGRYLREAVTEAWPWARSVICAGLVYNTASERPPQDAARGWISRYAWGDDYHDVLRAPLQALAAQVQEFAEQPAEFKVTVDTAPLVEREAGVQAGLGWQGKNTCLIHPRRGSYFFLGAVVTSLEMAASDDRRGPQHGYAARPAYAETGALPDRCGSCTRCIEACPTQALEPYRMDARRCLAYLNIELRGAVPEAFRTAMGDNLLGCDICQEVCPWNRRAPVTVREEFQPRPGLFAPLLEELAAMTEAEYRERFRHSAVKRAKYAGLRRNLAIVMGNSGNPSFRPRLEQWAAGGDAELAEQAAWALERLSQHTHHATS